jgi:hypothetical protein
MLHRAGYNRLDARLATLIIEPTLLKNIDRLAKIFWIAGPGLVYGRFSVTGTSNLSLVCSTLFSS